MSGWKTDWEEEIELSICKGLDIDDIEHSHCITVTVDFLTYTADLKIRHIS
jgi:hypothetical protein